VPSAITLWGRGLEGAGRNIIEVSFGLWGKNNFGIEFKSFLFNLVQGKLYLNNVLHRIRPDENDGKCTFCRIAKIKELVERGIGEERPEYGYYLGLIEAETLSHIFWECEIIQSLVQQCYRWMCGNVNGVIDKDTFMIGKEGSSKMITMCDVTWKHYVKFFVYQCRSRKTIPTFGSLRYEMEGFGINTQKMKWEEYRLWLSLEEE